MSVLRNKIIKKYTSIPNQIIIDGQLSHGAFRVFTYLLSKPDGWTVINADIQKQLNIKQSQTLANYWKELITSGWISRYRIKNDEGKIAGGFDYELNEYPVRSNVDASTLGNNHIMENPQYDESINREKPQYINNTKEQEHNKTNFIKTNPPTVLNPNEHTRADVVQKWLEQIKLLNCQFTRLEMEAIKEWARYKTVKSPIYDKQIECTLKILEKHKANKFDIVYMIQISIASGYGKIMDPTKACIAKPAAKVVNSKYQAKHYIVPQTEVEKNELLDYITCCYISKNDPRTGKPMTQEQIYHIGKHFKFGLSKGINQEKYIFLNEVETGVSLLEQPI